MRKQDKHLKSADIKAFLVNFFFQIELVKMCNVQSESERCYREQFKLSSSRAWCEPPYLFKRDKNIPQ